MTRGRGSADHRGEIAGRRLSISRPSWSVPSGWSQLGRANVARVVAGAMLPDPRAQPSRLRQQLLARKAAGDDESAGAYSISEWYLLGDRWVDFPRGSFVPVPGGMTHDFQDRTSERAGVLNFSVPGNFEASVPGIARWFAEHPPGPA